MNIRFAVAIVITFVFSSTAWANGLPDGPYVSTSAEAQITLQADFAHLRVSGDFRGSTDKEAREGILKLQQALLEAIDPFENAIEPLKLDSVDSTIEEKWDGDRYVQLGYIDTFDADIKVVDLTKLDQLFHELSIVQGLDVNSPFFLVDDHESAEAKARDQALSNARAEAQALADSQGAALGQIWGIVYRAKHEGADPINWSGIFRESSELSTAFVTGSQMVVGSQIEFPIELDRKLVIYEAEVAVVYELIPNTQKNE